MITQIRIPHPSFNPETVNEEGVREHTPPFDLQHDYSPDRDVDMLDKSEGRARHMPAEVRKSVPPAIAFPEENTAGFHRQKSVSVANRQRMKAVLRRQVKYGEAFRFD